MQNKILSFLLFNIKLPTAIHYLRKFDRWPANVPTLHIEHYAQDLIKGDLVSPTPLLFPNIRLEMKFVQGASTYLAFTGKYVDGTFSQEVKTQQWAFFLKFNNYPYTNKKILSIIGQHTGHANKVILITENGRLSYDQYKHYYF